MKADEQRVFRRGGALFGFELVLDAGDKSEH